MDVFCVNYLPVSWPDFDCYFPVFSIRIRMDPHSFGCPGPGSVLEGWIRIRIQEHENLLKCKKMVSCLSKRLLYRKIWIRIEIKSWIRIRIGTTLQYILEVVNIIWIPMVLVPDTWSRQDLIKKGNLFRSVAVENMKTDYSIIFITTIHPTELSL